MPTWRGRSCTNSGGTGQVYPHIWDSQLCKHSPRPERFQSGCSREGRLVTRAHYSDGHSCSIGTCWCTVVAHRVYYVASWDTQRATPQDAAIRYRCGGGHLPTLPTSPYNTIPPPPPIKEHNKSKGGGWLASCEPTERIQAARQFFE